MLNQASATQTVQTLTVVAIGSTNPIKVKAVKNAFAGEDVNIVSCSASSNVRPQPLSNEETLQGAVNRAKDCLEKTDAQFAFGLEAGVTFLQGQVYLCHWGALVDRQGGVYFTNGPIILLPSSYEELLVAGQSLEEIMHSSTGIQDLGKKEGSIGIYTQGRLNREQVLTQITQVLLGQYCSYALGIKK